MKKSITTTKALALQGYSLAGLGIVADASALKPGQVALANESAFNNAFLSQPLTAYASGQGIAEDLQALLDYLAPQVTTARRFEYEVANDAANLAAEADDSDIRALGGVFKTITYNGQIVQSKTYSKGLTRRFDRDQLEDGSLTREEIVAFLKRRLLVGEIIRATALIRANTTEAAKTWSAAVSGAWADPDADVMAALAAISKNSPPNRLVYGRQTWARRFAALRSGDPGKAATALMAPDQLAALLNVESIRSSQEVYFSDAGTSNGIINPKHIYGFNGITGATRFDPSNLKRFVSHADGTPFQVFEQEVSSHVIDITVSHYSNIVCPDASGLLWLTIN
ncbi:MAG: hypothetical protein FWG50_13105 [Kiritimatiellaeota bacterium]|nr:hypothetical protein [Kiritimatiellota bacterium]